MTVSVGSARAVVLKFDGAERSWIEVEPNLFDVNLRAFLPFSGYWRWLM